MESIDTTKINLSNFLSHNIWELLDKINPDLIEKIHILKIYNDDASRYFNNIKTHSKRSRDKTKIYNFIQREQ